MNKIKLNTRRFLIAALTFGCLLAISIPSSAYQRKGGGTATTTTEDAGNTLTPFNVSIDTTTAVAVYTKTSGRVDRIFRICNDQTATYSILLSTASNVTGTATQSTLAHDVVKPNECNTMIAPSQTMYGVFKSSSDTGAFTGGRAYGYKRYDSKD
jgi:hypothetical protein